MSKFYTSVIQYGNRLLFRGVNNGNAFKFKVPFKPKYYVKSKSGQPTPYKTLDGIPLQEIEFGDIKEAAEFEKRYKGVTDFDMYGQSQFRYQFIAEEYPNEIKFDKEHIRVFSIDIETATEEGFPNLSQANEEILLITIKDNAHKQIVTFGTRDFVSDRPDAKYIKSTNEELMLKTFVDFWQRNCPDVITGWNINGFDIPYLVNRLYRVCGENWVNKLSPWEQVREKDIYANGQNIKGYVFTGISTLDYLDLYKKFTYQNQESYRLDYIAQVELGEKKLENPYDNFKDFYTQDWNKFVKYNIHDVELVDKLEDKMKLIELAFTMAYNAKINYEDVFSPVRMWDVIIYNYLRDRNIVIPMKEDNTKSAEFEGAYVKDPLVGPHRYIASFDLNSLYPHLIMQYNMSPETLTDVKLDVNVDKLLHNVPIDHSQIAGLAVTANGWCYRKDIKGFLPALMEEMYNNRTKFKKMQLKAEQEYEHTKDKELLKEISRCKNLQMAMKIALNSAYGAIGNKYFRYYDLRIAEGITISGQLSIRWMANKLNQFMNKTLKTENKDYVIAIDTDSIYLTLERLVETTANGKTTEEKIQYMDKICEKVFQPFIDTGYQELAEYMNAYAQKMQMKREVLADKGIWVAKKRYVLNVHNSEGVQYAKPKIKVMGLEMVKSSTPAVVRDKLKEALEVILYKDEKATQEFIIQFKEEFRHLPVEDVAFPRSVSNIWEFVNKDGSGLYKKGTPIHVRGSILFNHYIKHYGLTKKYQYINNGDKIKFVYLKPRNPINENVIAFSSNLPKEFKLHDCVDYDLQFEKTFLDAIKIIIEPIGWNAERQSSLDLMFA